MQDTRNNRLMADLYILYLLIATCADKFLFNLTRGALVSGT